MSYLVKLVSGLGRVEPKCGLAPVQGSLGSAPGPFDMGMVCVPGTCRWQESITTEKFHGQRWS